MSIGRECMQYSTVYTACKYIWEIAISHLVLSDIKFCLYAGLSAIDPLTVAQLRIFRYLADLGDSRTVTDPQTQNAFDLYQSCLDDSTIENLGVQPLLDVINNFIGICYRSPGV